MADAVAKPARHWVMQMQIFSVYRPYKESISKEMNNDNDLNLHSMTKLSGWLRYWADVHLRMHFGLKLFQKANGCLLMDNHKRRGYFLSFVKVLSL